jgi:hypothetical protein
MMSEIFIIFILNIRKFQRVPEVFLECDWVIRLTIVLILKILKN